MKKIQIALLAILSIVFITPINSHALLFRAASGLSMYDGGTMQGGAGASFEYDAGMLNLGIGVYQHQLEEKLNNDTAQSEGSLTSIPIYVKYYIPVPIPLISPSVAVGYTFQNHTPDQDKIDAREANSGAVGTVPNLSAYSEQIQHSPFIQAGIDYTIFLLSPYIPT